MQEARNAPFTCGSDYDCSTLGVNGMKVILALGPHPRQAGEMVDLLHIIERCLQQFRIKYRAPDILHCRGCTSWRTKIKNTHATMVREKGRHQMLPNKAAATCNECLPH